MSFLFALMLMTQVPSLPQSTPALVDDARVPFALAADAPGYGFGSTTQWKLYDSGARLSRWGGWSLVAAGMLMVAGGVSYYYGEEEASIAMGSAALVLGVGGMFSLNVGHHRMERAVEEMIAPDSGAAPKGVLP